MLNKCEQKYEAVTSGSINVTDADNDSVLKTSGKDRWRRRISRQSPIGNSRGAIWRVVTW